MQMFGVCDAVPAGFAVGIRKLRFQVPGFRFTVRADLNLVYNLPKACFKLALQFSDLTQSRKEHGVWS